ncbi:MAG: elongation factor P-like protein YeiP [Lentisphaerae bacterium]|nr:elongation factor P-like protein YeiP [Lentisphaerota bacterium]
MPKACELKKGSMVSLNGAPHVVEDLTVRSPSARGAATYYHLRFRNLVTRQKEDRSCKGDDPFDSVSVERREVQFSYLQGDSYVFMDLADFTEFELKATDIEDQRQYLREDLDGLVALISEGRVLTIELPDVVELKVAECEPSIRGATATARTKPATLTTGLVVQVPEYMAPGEMVRVDTRTGKFLSRA